MVQVDIGIIFFYATGDEISGNIAASARDILENLVFEVLKFVFYDYMSRSIFVIDDYDRGYPGFESNREYGLIGKILNLRFDSLSIFIGQEYKPATTKWKI
jgi:hypothetical protein